VTDANSTRLEKLRKRRATPVTTPSDLNGKAAKEVGAAMSGIVADVFAPYLKTKNFHWHMTGPHFRHSHLLLDEQADRIFALTDAIAERVRKIRAPTLKSIGQIAKAQRDIATARLVDEGERSGWFLFASIARPESGGR
jgi:starvation-inducible DNA-binding protein